MLQLPAPESRANASYVNTFAGPALSCSHVSGDLFDSMIDNINKSSYAMSASYGYLSWMHTEGATQPLMPFTPKRDSTSKNSSTSNETSYVEQLWTLGPVPDLYAGDVVDGLSVSPPTIFVATFPGMVNSYLTSGSYAVRAENATIVQCQLVNLTYEASFNWTNGIREVQVSTTPSTNPVTAFNGIDCDHFVFVPDWQNDKARNLSAYNNSLVQAFAYQSVMDAFGRVLLVSISSASIDQGNLRILQTSVMNTVVGDVAELAFFKFFASGTAESLSQTFGSDATGVLNTGMEIWAGVSVQDDTTSKLDLRSTLEELFQNITMSLMTSALLRFVHSASSERDIICPHGLLEC